MGWQIGMHFLNNTGKLWRCTDVGTRTVLAIEIDPERDEHWYVGPPYVVKEVVFDEIEMAAAYRNRDEALRHAMCDFNRNIHPDYSGFY